MIRASTASLANITTQMVHLDHDSRDWVEREYVKARRAFHTSLATSSTGFKKGFIFRRVLCLARVMSTLAIKKGSVGVRKEKEHEVLDMCIRIACLLFS